MKPSAEVRTGAKASLKWKYTVEWWGAVTVKCHGTAGSVSRETQQHAA